MGYAVPILWCYEVSATVFLNMIGIFEVANPGGLRLGSTVLTALNSGLWVVFPAYMTIVFGTDILEALDLAAESSSAAAKKKY